MITALWPPDSVHTCELDGSERRTDCCPFYECDEDYWDSLGPDDAAPRRNPCTFDGETFWIDLLYDSVFDEAVEFQCDGDAFLLIDQDSRWPRLSGDVNNCDQGAIVLLTRSRLTAPGPAFSGSP